MASKAAEKIAAQHNAGVGGNSVAPAKQFAADNLKSLVDRVERLEEEKKGLAEDIRGIFAEAKGNGFDVKALRAVIRDRKQDPADLAEQAAIRDTYRFALGMCG